MSVFKCVQSAPDQRLWESTACKEIILLKARQPR